MIEKPKITNSPEQLIAMIHLTVARAEIRNVMGPGLSEIHAALAAQGIAAAGSWFTHHLRMDPKVFDFEICVPVKSPVSAAGRVTPGKTPDMKVVRTVYHGDYEALGAAWGEFDEWIKKEGLTTEPGLWERYTVGPESSPDPKAWRTELSRIISK
ncbi:MAG TPA: GyrI-like domain-containing protein [Spirochaetia bacterium]|nr:GyrI-like domain-containing protein [Spirochaetia bacterium]